MQQQQANSLQSQQTLPSSTHHLLSSLPPPKFTNQNLKQIQSKYFGIMTLLKRKVDKKQIELGTQYFSSSILNDMKQKRNTSLNDEAMEKMFNQYKIKEYGSNFDKNVFDCDKIVFDQYEYYEALEIRAVDKK